MRRSVTNEVVLSIALALAAAAIAFAWTQSRPAAPQAAPPPVAMSQEPATHDQGQATDRLPPLRGHAVELFQADGGREYLAKFMLYGLRGEIDAGGRTYRGRHPVYKDRLSDEQIAAVLNHMLTSWQNDRHLGISQELYEPDDIAPLRQYPLSLEEVRELRPTLPPVLDPSSQP